MEDTKSQIADTNELDAAGKSLSEALRISFGILKIIMILLVIVFLASGFKTVGPDEQAIVLQFGKIRGISVEDRILGPGLHWVFPYPINEIIKIPVKKKISLPLNSFWYYQESVELLPENPKIKVRVPRNLDPLRDGYCITRSEKQDVAIAASGGSDYNIVHSKWQLYYQIDDPERFFRNVYVEDIKPGELYFDVITKSLRPLLRDLLDNSVVTAMVKYTIDEALSSSSRIPGQVKRLLQEKLDTIESGIKVVSIQLTDVTQPRQVDEAFLASIKASQERHTAIDEARTYAEKTLNEAAGPVGGQLLDALREKAVGGDEKELLWVQLAGRAQEKIAQAKAYRTKVVESAKADAEYLLAVLPEYRKYPELVIQRIYQDAMEQIFENVDEKFIVQPTAGGKATEIRILVNRDPTIKQQKAEK